MHKAVFVALGMITLSQQAFSAGDPEYMEFILKQAHQRSFTQCDSAIREVFSLAGGSDMRVLTYDIPGMGKDALKIHAVYGSVGDVVQKEAEFIRVGQKCTFSMTSHIVNAKSCAAVMGENSAFKFKAETSGVIYMENSGGVDMILTPVGLQGCLQTYLRINSTQISN